MAPQPSSDWLTVFAARATKSLWIISGFLDGTASRHKFFCATCHSRSLPINCKPTWHSLEVEVFNSDIGFPSIFAKTEARTTAPTAMREKTKVIVLVQLYLAVLVAVGEDGRMRCIQRKRLDWVEHSNKLLREGLFTQCYRMSARAVEALTKLLAPSLQCDEAQSRRRTGIEPITPINKVVMCLRWMGGGSSHEIREIGGVSMSAFFASVYQVIDALIQHPDLRLHFPSDEFELDQAARGFQRLSSHGALNGCVGAIDGWLCPIRVPRKTEVKRVRSFFSGHYHRFGVNVQACCDHLSRFTAISCTSGGSTGDALAYIRWKLSHLVARLRDGFYVAGDNAYVNGLHLLTPFPRPKINSIYRDSYNYHLSQLRIRIEMAFGLLVQKWRIFRAPLEVALANVPRVVMAGAILHNWCINQRLLGS